jgi:hypothetical protein
MVIMILFICIKYIARHFKRKHWRVKSWGPTEAWTHEMITLHCKCFDHKNYGEWKLQGPCRENLHYLCKRAVRIAGKPRDNYKSCNYYWVSPQFLQPFSIDSTDFPCRDPAISSPRSFYGQNICSVVQCIFPKCMSLIMNLF